MEKSMIKGHSPIPLIKKSRMYLIQITNILTLATQTEFLQISDLMENPLEFIQFQLEITQSLETLLQLDRDQSRDFQFNKFPIEYVHLLTQLFISYLKIILHQHQMRKDQDLPRTCHQFRILLEALQMIFRSSKRNQVICLRYHMEHSNALDSFVPNWKVWWKFIFMCLSTDSPCAIPGAEVIRLASLSIELYEIFLVGSATQWIEAALRLHESLAEPSGLVQPRPHLHIASYMLPVAWDALVNEEFFMFDKAVQSLKELLSTNSSEVPENQRNEIYDRMIQVLGILGCRIGSCRRNHQTLQKYDIIRLLMEVIQHFLKPGHCIAPAKVLQCVVLCFRVIEQAIDVNQSIKFDLFVSKELHLEQIVRQLDCFVEVISAQEEKDMCELLFRTLFGIYQSSQSLILASPKKKESDDASVYVYVKIYQQAFTTFIASKSLGVQTQCWLVEFVKLICSYECRDPSCLKMNEQVLKWFINQTAWTDLLRRAFTTTEDKEQLVRSELEEFYSQLLFSTEKYDRFYLDRCNLLRCLFESIVKYRTLSPFIHEISHYLSSLFQVRRLSGLFNQILIYSADANSYLIHFLNILVWDDQASRSVDVVNAHEGLLRFLNEFLSASDVRKELFVQLFETEYLNRPSVVVLDTPIGMMIDGRRHSMKATNSQLFATLYQVLQAEQYQSLGFQILEVLMLQASWYMFHQAHAKAEPTASTAGGLTQPIRKIDIEAYLQEYLFQQFFQYLSQYSSMKSSTLSAVDGIYQAVLMLERVLVAEHERYLCDLQTLCQEIGAFVHIYNLLLHQSTSTTSFTNAKQVTRCCNAVCHLLTVLMKKNKQTKGDFRQLMNAGYEHQGKIVYEPLRQALLLVNEEPMVEWSTFEVILDMLTDGNYLASTSCPSQPTIENPDVISLLFSLILNASAESQHQLILYFISILRPIRGSNVHVLNREMCCRVQPAVMDQLLDIFENLSEETQIQAIQLIQYLGTHCINVKQHKRIFRLMQQQSCTKEDQSVAVYRPPWTWRFLRAFCKMIVDFQKDGPSRFFLFDGIRSGLHIPPLPQSSSARGYSFATYIRISAPNTATTTQGTRGCIYSFLTREKQGFRCWVDENHIVFDSLLKEENGESISRKAVRTPVELQVERWYFLGITHRLDHVCEKTKAITQSCESATISVFLDGHLRWTESNLRTYPLFAPACVLQHCHIGMSPASIDGTEWTSRVKGVKNTSTNLKAQIGAIYFFNRIITAEEMQAIYSFGPDYAFTEDSSNKNSFTTGDELSQFVFLCYQPTVWEGNYFLDNSPEHNKSVMSLSSTGLTSDSISSASTLSKDPRHQMYRLNARRLEGTHDIATRNVCAVMECAGGVSILFPLFAQFDQPLTSASSSPEPRLTIYILRFISLLLLQQKRNVKTSMQKTLSEIYFTKHHRFLIIGYLLKRLTPTNLSLESLETIVNFITQMIQHSQEQSISSLALSAIHHLVTDFELWRFTPQDVQLKLIASIQHLLRENLELIDVAGKETRACHAIETQDILDALRKFFWFVPPTSILSNEDIFVPQRSGNMGPNQVKTRLTELSTVTWIHPATGIETRVSWTSSELVEIRHNLLQLLRVLFTTQGCSRNESEDGNWCSIASQALCWLRFLFYCGDDIQRIDLLQFMIDLMQDPDTASSIVSSFSTIQSRIKLDAREASPFGAIHLLLSSITRPGISAFVKLHTLQLICQFIETTVHDADDALDLWQSTFGEARPAEGYYHEYLSSVFSMLIQTVEDAVDSQDLIRLLLHNAVGLRPSFCPIQYPERAQPVFAMNRPEEGYVNGVACHPSSPVLLLSHPWILQAILSCSFLQDPQASSPTLVSEVVDLTCHCIHENGQNCTTLLTSIKEWHFLLFSITLPHLTGARGIDIRDHEDNLASKLIQVFTNCALFAMTVGPTLVKKGWKTVNEILSLFQFQAKFLRLSDGQDEIIVIDIWFRFLESFLRNLVTKSRSEDWSTNIRARKQSWPDVAQNLWNVAVLVEYDLFQRCICVLPESSSSHLLHCKYQLAELLIDLLYSSGMSSWTEMNAWGLPSSSRRQPYARQSTQSQPSSRETSWIERNSPKGGMIRLILRVLLASVREDGLYCLNGATESKDSNLATYRLSSITLSHTKTTQDRTVIKSLERLRWFLLEMKSVSQFTDDLASRVLVALVETLRTFYQLVAREEGTSISDYAVAFEKQARDIIDELIKRRQAFIRLRLFNSELPIEAVVGSASTRNREEQMNREDEFLHHLQSRIELDFQWSTWTQQYHDNKGVQERIYSLEILGARERLVVKLQMQSTLAQLKVIHGLKEHWSIQIQRILYNHLQAEEIKRWNKSLLRDIEVRNLAATNWQSILRDLVNERGPWGIGTPNAAKSVEWKLDRSENKLRQRMKLKRKHYRSSLRIHSKKERLGSFTMAQSNEAAQLSLANDLLQAKALALYPKAAPVSALPQTIRANIISTPTSTSSPDQRLEEMIIKTPPSSKSKAPASGKRYGSASRKASERKSVEQFQIKCEIIVPLAKTKGVLTIASRRIEFVCHEDPTASSEEPKQRDLNQLLMKPHDKEWVLDQLRHVAFRKYQYCCSALEFFFLDGSTVFINFFEKQHSIATEQFLRSLHPPNLLVSQGRRPHMIYKRSSSIVERWRNREISNFEYLMYLNTIAGRTYNDLAQYPIFPWVIADYESDTIDLGNPATFRDLSKPIGLQKEAAYEYFQQRYEMLDHEYNSSMASAADPGVLMDKLPPYHHGTHYSCPGFVINYLIRIDPFTSLHLHLQNGKFDHADRLFHSIADTYQSCTTNRSDVRELTPEWYYFPEMFLNTNKLDLGRKQNHIAVDDVVLPKWAKTAHDFVQINRKALESDYVSQHLHEWIDLIFGYKQRPPWLPNTHGESIEHIGNAPITACNVFFHLTYEGAVDLEKLKLTDPHLYHSFRNQIDNFGQTPSQLLFRPHPKRLAYQDTSAIYGTLTSPSNANLHPKAREFVQQELAQDQRFVGHPRYRVSPCGRSILLVAELRGRKQLVTIDEDRFLGLHKWKTLPPDIQPPFTLDIDAYLEDWESTINKSMNATTEKRKRFMKSTIESRRYMHIGTPFATRAVTTYSESRPLTPWLFAVHPNGKYLLSCGHWDYSIKITSLEEGKIGHCLQSLFMHQDVVNCVALAENGQYLVTGSSDASVFVWEIQESIESSGALSKTASKSRDEASTKDSNLFTATPIYTLYGHDDAVTCVAVDMDLDMVVSASDDGSLIIHTLYRGQYVRSIYPEPTRENPSGVFPITWCGISPIGSIVLYSNLENQLRVYSVNGHFLASADVNQKLQAFVFSEDGKTLLTGGRGCTVVLYNVAEGLSVEMEYDGSDIENGIPIFKSPIQSLSLSERDMHLMVGLESGELAIYTLNAQYLRDRLQKKLTKLGF